MARAATTWDVLNAIAEPQRRQILFSIALSPVLFGAGIRLFEGVDASRVALELVRSESSPRVTRLNYAVRTW